MYIVMYLNSWFVYKSAYQWVIGNCYNNLFVFEDLHPADQDVRNIQHKLDI